MPIKSNLYKKILLNDEFDVYLDPIYKLLDNYDEINAISNNENFPKLFFFNCKNVHYILYEFDKTIYIKYKPIETNKSFYFYLSLLIRKEPNIINYEYSFDLIKKINNENNAKDYFNKIIKSIIILELLDNFRGFENYEEEYNIEIDKIEKENKININNNIYHFKELNSKIDENYLKEKDIDEIYIEIIISLIKKDKLSDYNYTYKIISSLKIENIELTNLMLEKLKDALSANENYVEKYMILTEQDLSNISIINFHYILLKFIIKSSIYIYNIPFLLKNRKNIICIIKENKKEISYSDFGEKKRYVIKKYIDSNYYLKLLESRNELKEKINNNKLNTYDKSKFINKPNNPGNEMERLINGDKKSTKVTDKSITNDEKNGKNYFINDKNERNNNSNEENNIICQILHYSVFIIHSNEKGKDPFFIFENVYLGEKKINITEKFMKEKENIKTTKNKAFQLFLLYLIKLEKSIKNQFKYNYCLKLK